MDTFQNFTIRTDNFVARVNDAVSSVNSIDSGGNFDIFLVDFLQIAVVGDQFSGLEDYVDRQSRCHVVDLGANTIHLKVNVDILVLQLFWLIVFSCLISVTLVDHILVLSIINRLFNPRTHFRIWIAELLITLKFQGYFDFEKICFLSFCG
jgi:hypothetical protein